MRLFLAITIPDELKREIMELQKQLNIGNISMPKPEALHLTLFFIGNMEPLKADNLKKILKKTEFFKFSLKTSKIGFFYKSNKLRIVHLALEDSKELSGLAEKIDHVLLELGIKRDLPFKPHITVARVKSLSKKENQEIIKKAETINKKKDQISFQASNFKLYSSTLTPKGPVYEVLETFEFR